MSVLLRRDVYVCLTTDHAVFFHLGRDRYVGLDTAGTRTLCSLMKSNGSMESNGSAPSDIRALVHELLHQDLLTLDHRMGKPLAQTTIAIASTSLLEPPAQKPLRIKVSHVLRFAAAHTKAKILLHRPIARVVQRIALENLRSAPLRPPFNYALAQDLVRISYRIRPFFYAVKNNCVLNSVVLREFLKCYGIYPTWVFGVKTRPFQAHCWLQDDGFVINDRPEHVRTFTPIFAV
jgi:hypothetical protein